MAAATVTTADGILKQRYPAKKVQFVGYMDNPFLALVPKDTTFTGSVYDIPIFYGGNMGGSRAFSTAQANKTAGLYKKFLLTRTKDYALGSIETEAVLATMDDAGAFLKLTTSEVDNTIRNGAQNLNVSLFRNFGGSRGRVGSVATTVLTLKQPADIVNFGVGMKVTSSNTDGTSGSDDAQALTITAIDRDAGTITTSVTWTAGGNFSNDDYLFREGDFGVSLSGLDSWLPASAPASTAFFGVDRTSDVVRLGGMRYDGSTQSIEEALQSADTKLCREGSRPSHCIMNTDDYGDLRLAMGSRVFYDKVASPDMASVGFRSIRIVGAKGDIQIVPDRNCPKGVAYMLQMDTWTLASLGPAPRFLQAMGQNEVIWDYNADSVEFRAGYYAQLGCRAPGFNCRIALPTG